MNMPICKLHMQGIY